MVTNTYKIPSLIVAPNGTILHLRGAEGLQRGSRQYPDSHA